MKSKYLLLLLMLMYSGLTFAQKKEVICIDNNTKLNILQNPGY